MTKYDQCPRCNQKPFLPNRILIVYQCLDDGEPFCDQCNDANNGLKCPACGSERKIKIGEVNFLH